MINGVESRSDVLVAMVRDGPQDIDCRSRPPTNVRYPFNAAELTMSMGPSPVDMHHGSHKQVTQ
jgi:hypothetical protein